MSFLISLTSVAELKLRGVGAHFETVNALSYNAHFKCEEKSQQCLFSFPETKMRLLIICRVLPEILLAVGLTKF